MFVSALSLVAATNALAASPQIGLGPGCTTAYHIDWDCDGYGVGTDPNDPNPLLGPDADDNDPSVNTPDSMLAKWGTVSAFMAHLGYNQNNIWYLSTTGSDATCAANNAALPCLTWSYVYSASSAGDAILVRGGTFTANANYSIGRPGTSAAHPDILMSYPGELAVLDHGVGGWYGISADLGTVNYTIIDGLKIQNTPLSSPTHEVGGMGIDLNSAGPIYGDIIRNCEVQDYYRGIWAIAGHNGTLVERNVIHDNYGGGSGEHNIYLGSNSYGGMSTGVVVQNNILYNAAWDNFHFNGPCNSCMLSGNIMYSANLAAGGGSGNVALQEGWNHSTVQNNIIFNASASAVQVYDYDDSQAPVILPYDQNYNVFRNNTFIHTGQDWSGQALEGYTPISIINGSAQTSPLLDLGHNTYDNNVFVEMAATVAYNAAVVRYGYYSSSDLNWLSTDTWRNNILYAANGAPPLAIGIGTTPPTQDWSYFGANALVFTDNSQANPLLLGANDAWYNAPQNWNPQVAAGGPAIGAGLASDAPATDIMGNSRGSAPDIGAYQYGESPNSIPLTINTAVLNGGTVGTAYTQGLSASGGTTPYSWLLTSGTLPVGLALSSTGAIGGTPVAAGTSGITVEVQDSAGHRATAGWSITIAPVAASLSALNCTPDRLSSGNSSTCTLTLSGAAPTGGSAVALASDSVLLSVPSSVTVAAGAASAGFTATAGNIPSDQRASVTATLNGSSQSVSMALCAAPGITIQTNPTGLQFSVDGGAVQTAPQTLNLAKGSHCIAVTTIQAGRAGTQYAFTEWSDGEAAAHSITVVAAATYTAGFKTQYQLTTAASPAAAGVVTPASGGFYDSGTAVPISAAANGGYSFSNWTSSVANANSASTTVTMSAPEAAAANFNSVTSHPAFFAGEAALTNGVYYLQFQDGKLLGYYTYVGNGWIYHFDMGYEYVYPGNGPEAFLWDSASGHWWYTNTGTFPYLYDFTLNAWIYYFPATNNAGHYTTNPRYFVNMTTGQIFTL